MNPTTRQGSIYVIHADGTNRIKIGYTQNLKERSASIQTGCPYPIKVLTTWPGQTWMEKEIHKYFSKFRCSGEWFEIEPLNLEDIERVLNTIKESGRKARKEKRVISKRLITKLHGLDGFAVDPIRISAHTWRIRIRCRRAKCFHVDHPKIFNVSLIADSVIRLIRRDANKYALWKRSILAESSFATGKRAVFRKLEV